jgi:hypothetical protein
MALTVQAQQIELQSESPLIQRGQQAYNTAQALANRIYLVGQQQHDQKLMDLLSRHGVVMNAPPSLPGSTTAPTPTAAPVPEPHY